MALEHVKDYKYRARVSLAGAAKSIIFVATEVCLSRQNYVCRDKIMFVATKLCLSVSKKYLPRLRFCRNKHTFFRGKHVSLATAATSMPFVSPNVLSQQAYFCREKYLSRDKHTFVATSILFNKNGSF